jgi:hypothetical protein
MKLRCHCELDFAEGKLRDEMNLQRRKLPGVKTEKKYVFDGMADKATLADLLGGKSQLIIFHFMFGPGWRRLRTLLVLGRPFRQREFSYRTATARHDVRHDFPRVDGIYIYAQLRKMPLDTALEQETAAP